MPLTEVFRIILLLLLLGCVIGVNLTRSILQSVLVFVAYSGFMCLLWILMEDGVEHPIDEETFRMEGWWLRDAGYGGRIAFVDQSGMPSSHGRFPDDRYICVRPALWVSIAD